MGAVSPIPLLLERMGTGMCQQMLLLTLRTLLGPWEASTMGLALAAGSLGVILRAEK